jgi:hypothetical protein
MKLATAAISVNQCGHLTVMYTKEGFGVDTRSTFKCFACEGRQTGGNACSVWRLENNIC